MENSIFYDFYQNAGFKVYTSESAEWCELQKGMLISIPYHRLINPSEEELDDLLKTSGAWGVRYPTSTENFGFPSKLQICDRVGYDLGLLEHKFRNRVVKGQKQCQIRDVSIEELMTEGYRLNLSTLERQERDDPKSNEEYWKNYCKGLAETKGVRILGAYHEDKLAAYIVIFETPSMIELIIQNSDSELLTSCCPNNALTYYVTWHYLTEEGHPLPLCYGLGSLEETPDLDRYKIGMGYSMLTIKQRLYFKKSIRIFLRPSVLKIGEMANKYIIKGRSYTLVKSFAILRRYLEQQ